MNYAEELLKKEASLLERCLSDWESDQYPEAKKERDKKLKEINEVINLIKLKNESAKYW